MNNGKLIKKKLQNIIKEKISAGFSKQEIYDELTLKFSNRNTIVELLENIVSNKTKNKYSHLNTILLISLSIIAFIDLSSVAIGGVIIDSLLIYCVATYKIKYYTWIALRGFISMLVAGAMLIFNKDIYNDPKTIIAAISTFILIIASFFFGLYLANKLSPDYIEKRVPYINKNGDNRLMIVHHFED